MTKKQEEVQRPFRSKKTQDVFDLMVIVGDKGGLGKSSVHLTTADGGPPTPTKRKAKKR